MNPSRHAFVVRRADWLTDREGLRIVRESVFVHEQKVPLEMEWDQDDPGAVHYLALDERGSPVGTGRLTMDDGFARIGRMSVLRAWRGRGVGTALLEALMAAAREYGMREVVLSAQAGAVGFYRRYGYTEEGGEFMEAGIPHVHMRCRL